jgi:hypothetical protein
MLSTNLTESFVATACFTPVEEKALPNRMNPLILRYLEGGKEIETI